MHFSFYSGAGYSGNSGYLAFVTPPPTAGSSGTASSSTLLLVTDHGHDAVHLVDVVNQRHAGYVAPPGSIAGPRGVAACGTATSALVAISAWKKRSAGLTTWCMCSWTVAVGGT